MELHFLDEYKNGFTELVIKIRKDYKGNIKSKTASARQICYMTPPNMHDPDFSVEEGIEYFKQAIINGEDFTLTKIISTKIQKENQKDYLKELENFYINGE